jgi:hypothetical protein
MSAGYVAKALIIGVVLFLYFWAIMPAMKRWVAPSPFTQLERGHENNAD